MAETSVPERKLLRDTGSMFIAQGIGYFFNLLGGLVIAGILGTRLYGVWKGVQLVLDYSAYLNFGSNHGIDRKGPALVSSGRTYRFQQIFSASLGFSLFVHITVALGFLALCLTIQDSDWQMALLALVFLLPLQPFFNHGDTGLGAEKKFSRKALIFLSMTVSRVVISIFAGYFFGLAGVLTVFVVMVAGAGIAMLRSLSIRPVPSIDFRKARSLIFAGGSITALVCVERLMMSLDRIIVGFCLGTESFGVYNMVIFPLPILLLLPFALRQTVQTEIYDRMESTGSLESCFEIFSRSVTVISLFLPFIMGAVYLGMPFLISQFLPDFSDAIPVVKVFAITSFFLMIIQTTFSVVVVARRARYVIKGMLMILMFFSFLSLGAGLIFQSMVAILLIQSIGWLTLSFWLLNGALSWFGKSGRETVSYLRSWVLPVVFTAIWLVFLEFFMIRFLEWPMNSWQTGFGGGAIHCAYCLPYLILLEKRTGGIRFFLKKFSGRTLKN